jgi:hypothetical protein
MESKTKNKKTRQQVEATLTLKGGSGRIIV